MPQVMPVDNYYSSCSEDENTAKVFLANTMSLIPAKKAKDLEQLGSNMEAKSKIASDLDALFAKLA